LAYLSEVAHPPAVAPEPITAQVLASGTSIAIKEGC